MRDVVDSDAGVPDSDGAGGAETLEGLADEHDVVFLLVDSRESRWLRTVMGAALKEKVSGVLPSSSRPCISVESLLNELLARS